MRFWDHLDELRSRLIKVAIAVLAGTVLSFFAADWILAVLLRPLPSLNPHLISLQPAGVFVQSMKISFMAGFVFTLPIVLYQLWSFISPGLLKKEARLFVTSLYIGTLLFMIGVLFAYFLVSPTALQFFLDYSQRFGIQPDWTLEYYLKFVLMFLLSFGLAFELPVVVVLLIKMNIVSHAAFVSKRPHIVIGIAILAGALTPPDVVSQLALGIPMWILFELALLFSRRWRPQSTQ